MRHGEWVRDSWPCWVIRAHWYDRPTSALNLESLSAKRVKRAHWVESTQYWRLAPVGAPTIFNYTGRRRSLARLMLRTGPMQCQTSSTFASISEHMPRIVLAEDDRLLRELLASALECEGYRVSQASTGNDLIGQIRGLVASGERVDLVVSDIRMPKMNGLLVLKLLRDAEFDMPVILITAFSDVCTRKEAGEYGAVLLDKPVQLRTLRGEVKRLLDRGAGR